MDNFFRVFGPAIAFDYDKLRPNSCLSNSNLLTKSSQTKRLLLPFFSLRGGCAGKHLVSALGQCPDSDWTVIGRTLTTTRFYWFLTPRKVAHEVLRPLTRGMLDDRDRESSHDAKATK